jgi:hypothetical protein
VRETTGTSEILDLVELADGFHPPVDVDAEVGAGQAHVVADGECEVTAGPNEFVGDLESGRGGAADQPPLGPRSGRGCDSRSR